MAADTDVLIVGAGPTGLTMACELVRRGVSVRVIDRAPAASENSKALVVHARTLEIFDDMGIADTLIERGVAVRGVTMWAGGEVVVSAGFEELDSRYNFALSIPQSETEKTLTELYEKLGGKVERDVELFSFRQDGTGVTSIVKTKDGEQRIRSAWIVGCDGAHSTVRKQLDLPFGGSTYDERFLLADVKIQWDTRDDRISTFFGDEGICACFPLPGGRWRLIATATAGDESQDAPTLEAMQDLFTKRTAVAGVLSDASWLSRFRIHCRQVLQYRDDRAFLAGDAAHIHSPIGGQGMNVGIQDAHNLGWKLALVHRGQARGRVLDSYETERHAVGAALLRGTDLATKVGTLKGTIAKSVRNEVAKVLSSFEYVQQRITREVAELTVAYEASPIVKEDRLSMLQARIGSAAGGETPTLGSHRDFEAGPKAGARAPDAKVSVAGSGGTKQLSKVIEGRVHTLLVFDGRSHTDEGYAKYAALDQRVRERWGECLRTFLVTPRPSRPASLPESITVLLDPDGDVEKRYAATTECVYLIRPDLYIGYRSQPVDEEKLVEYLRSILR